MPSANQRPKARSRYARQSLVVLGVFPKMMRELVSQSVHATAMYNLIPHLTKIKDRLTYDEKKIIETLPTDGYEKCDTMLLYKFIRQQLPKPGRGWGKNPVISNLSISDDVERIRLARNNLLHRPHPEVTEQEEVSFFQEFLDVARRIDTYLSKQPNETFESHILAWKCNSIDAELEEKCAAQAQEIEGLKLKLEEEVDKTPINLYLGKEIEAVIRSEKSSDSGKKRLKIVVKGAAEEQEVVDKLNQLKDTINEGNFQIVLEKANCGSIIIYVTVDEQITLREHEICRAVVEFLRHAFGLLSVMPVSEHGFFVCVLDFDELLDSEYDELTTFEEESDDNDYDSDDCLDFNPDDLVLTVSIDKNAFSCENQLFGETSTFIKDVLRRTNNSHNLLNSEEALNVIVHPFSSEEKTDLTYSQAQTSVNIPLPSKLSLRQMVKVNKGRFELYIRDCIILNHKIILTEHFAKRLIIHNFNGSLDRNIKLDVHPFGIADMNNQVVAVTSPEERIIVFINILTEEIRKSIKTEEKCYGITCSKGYIYVIIGKKIKVFDKLGNVMNSIPLPSSSIFYLQIRRDKIYYTDSSKNTVTCCDLNGTILWTESPSALSSPNGIIIDNNGNIIVAGYWSQNITLVSHKGRISRTLLTREDGLDFPRSVFYDTKRNILLICNECRDNAFLYDLEGDQYDFEQ